MGVRVHVCVYMSVECPCSLVAMVMVAMAVMSLFLSGCC